MISSLRNVIHRYTFSQYGLFVSIISYALATSCPHGIGFLEVITGSAIGIFVISTNFHSSSRPMLDKENFLLILGALLFLIPIVSMFNSVNPISRWAVLRDILPFMFLVLPVLIRRIDFVQAENTLRMLEIGLIFIGLSYSIRYLVGTGWDVGAVIAEQLNLLHAIPAAHEVTGAVGLSAPDVVGAGSSHQPQCAAENCLAVMGRPDRISRDPICLALDPAVLCSAIALFTAALIRIIRPPYKSMSLISSIVIALPPVMVLVLIANRASIIFMFLICVIILVHRFISLTPKYRAVILMLSGVAILALWPMISVVLNLLWQKQIAVGDNNKFAEWSAVIAYLSHQSLGMTIGAGWGSEFPNPAAGYVASFTHSIVSYFLLKSGLIGAILISVYIGCYANKIVRMFKFGLNSFRTCMLVGIGFVLSVSLLLQPLYKTPTFGFMLLYVSILYRVTTGVTSLTQHESAHHD